MAVTILQRSRVARNVKIYGTFLLLVLFLKKQKRFAKKKFRQSLECAKKWSEVVLFCARGCLVGQYLVRKCACFDR